MVRSGLARRKSLKGFPVAKVTMYSTAVCPYCVQAERLLKNKGVAEIEKIRVDLQPEQRDAMIEKTGRRTVPQIYIGDTHVGGFDDLSALDRAGGLDKLLAA
jgi:glutaredoxin 3